jgi:putative PIN family toxin of toxin-antitoxin system
VRLIVDTNILISALLSRSSAAAQLLDHWERQRFEVLTCEAQLDELTRVTRYPKIRARLAPGSLVNQLRQVATVVHDLPAVDVSADPADNWLPGLAEAGSADYIVSGDRRDVVALGKHGGTRIVTLVHLLKMFDGSGR